VNERQDVESFDLIAYHDHHDQETRLTNYLDDYLWKGYQLDLDS
jgi:hypothetical protein